MAPAPTWYLAPASCQGKLGVGVGRCSFAEAQVPAIRPMYQDWSAADDRLSALIMGLDAQLLRRWLWPAALDCRRSGLWHSRPQGLGWLPRAPSPIQSGGLLGLGTAWSWGFD
jgi:hypothetical protein